jgi:DNA recombination protein RmuC
MDPLLAIVIFIAGMGLGGAIIWFLIKGRIGQAQMQATLNSGSEKAALVERVAARESQISELNSVINKKDAEYKTLQAECSRLSILVSEFRTRSEEEHKSVQEKLALLNEAQTRLSDAFKAISAEALNKNNQSFLDLAKTTLEKYQDSAKTDLDTRHKAIDALVKPVKESLDKFDEKIQGLEKARIEAYVGLQGLVTELKDGQSKLKTETANLVKALRAPVVRGRWGEIQLKRVVEFAGMVQYCDFSPQESVDTGDGRLRPDMIIKLPKNRHIIIDSKAPLEAYLDALDAKDEEMRNQKLKDHARQVRDHFGKLGAKAYWEQFSPSPEFVVLFLPGESFFSAALEQDPTLIESCVSQKVILATPTTLIALLKAVAYGWQQENLEKNVIEIGKLGKELYDRVGGMADHIEQMGRSLRKTIEQYNNMIGTLESRVLVTTRKFKVLNELDQADIPEIQPITITTREPSLPSHSELNQQA